MYTYVYISYIVLSQCPKHDISESWIKSENYQLSICFVRISFPSPADPCKDGDNHLIEVELLSISGPQEREHHTSLNLFSLLTLPNLALLSVTSSSWVSCFLTPLLCAKQIQSAINCKSVHPKFSLHFSSSCGWMIATLSLASNFCNQTSTKTMSPLIFHPIHWSNGTFSYFLEIILILSHSWNCICQGQWWLRVY